MQQESTANVDEWKRQLHTYKEENMLLKRELDNIRSSNNNNCNSGTIESAGGAMGGTSGKSSQNSMEIEELNRELTTLKARNESLEMELLNQQAMQMKLNTNSKDNNV